MSAFQFLPHVLRRAVLASLLALLCISPMQAQAPAERPSLTNQQSAAAAAITLASMNQGQTTDSASTSRDAGFPEPFALSLLLIVICGAVGAFAADVLVDGRIIPPAFSEQGYMLGFVGNMIVGAVAAIIALCLNPGGDSLEALIGTALAAGVGGESMLRARAAAGEAQAARSDLQVWADKLDTLGEIAIAAHREGAMEARDGSIPPAGADDGFVRTIETYVTSARAELARNRASRAGSALLRSFRKATPSSTVIQPTPTV